MRITSLAAITLLKDWLDELGMDEPETTSDLQEIARAFSEEDPAGDGGRTTGLVIPAWEGYGNNGPYDLWETWQGTPNLWTDRHGVLDRKSTRLNYSQVSISYAVLFFKYNVYVE